MENQVTQGSSRSNNVTTVIGMLKDGWDAGLKDPETRPYVIGATIGISAVLAASFFCHTVSKK